ncbi:MAG: IS1182 family transposase [Acutalibacteraceae bacterium]
MLNKTEEKRNQIQVFCIEELVPQDHLLRKIERAIDWSFIYDLVENKYCLDNGRPSINPVTLIKIPIIQYMYGIKSMRQTIKEIEVNVAYRWFLGLDLMDKVPHFSTFGKNYSRRFKDTDIFEQIFSRILEECIKNKLVKPKEVFVDATHVKACANNKKVVKKIVQQEALFYEEQLMKEINIDREEHGKNPLKENNNKDNDNENNDAGSNCKEEKCSTTDPESGWFHKGEHKQVFAYSVETACDKNGWILGYTVNKGNLHDSRTFKGLFDKIKNPKIEKIIADAGYKTPAIAKLLLDENIEPIFPYKRPQTKDGFFKKYEYVYDEHFDCYICPNNQVLKYSTTNRDGYREYKSCGKECANCPYLSKCTESKNHVKVVTRHIWEDYTETCEDIRHTRGNKEIYNKRKETIERLFGTAKEHHGFRYTQLVGKAKMEMKVGLTFACLNLKKLAIILDKRREKFPVFQQIVLISKKITYFKNQAGLSSFESPALSTV